MGRRSGRPMPRDLDATIDPAGPAGPVGPAGPAAAAGDVIAVEQLALSYGRGASRVVALRDISFRVAEGTFTVVVGPSGCGKSTLLKVLAGLLPPTSGTAELRGQPITGPRRDIGV